MPVISALSEIEPFLGGINCYDRNIELKRIHSHDICKAYERVIAAVKNQTKPQKDSPNYNSNLEARFSLSDKYF